jgi:formamidopyrimidine-DNA glycosylase
MPELPEVETTVRDLQKKVLGRTFVDVWTDFKKIIKRPKKFEEFKKEIKGKKIKKVWRRGKNILFNLTELRALLIHQKLTGHLLLGYWILDDGYWKPKTKGLREEKINTFVHLLFTFDNGQMLALSDLRKFAKVELLTKEELKKELSSLGPEPLEKDFTFEKFEECLKGKKGKVKQVLMDQNIIAGIGNIYSDEILWQAKVHPFREIKRLRDEEIKDIYQAMRKILPKAIELGGESISDFRRPAGEKGGFDLLRKVYRREREKCSRCGTIIKRVKLAGRPAHFCPQCQK